MFEFVCLFISENKDRHFQTFGHYLFDHIFLSFHKESLYLIISIAAGSVRSVPPQWLASPVIDHPLDLRHVGAVLDEHPLVAVEQVERRNGFQVV